MSTTAPSGALVCAAVAMVASALWQVVAPARNAGADSHAGFERHRAALVASDKKPPPKALGRRADEEAFDIAVISDLNQGYGSTRYGPEVHRAVEALTDRFRTKLVLITGDM